MGKERSDSVLGSLPLHQQDQLIAWLIEERISPARAVDRVKQDFGVRTSETAMYTFWRRHCSPRLLRWSAEASDALPEASGGLTESWDKSSEALLQQKYFELLANPEVVNPKDLIAFGQLIRQGQTIALKKRELTAKEEGFKAKYEQKDREIALAREKFGLQKTQIKEQVAALQKSLQAPDAPLRVAKLVELIDAL